MGAGNRYGPFKMLKDERTRREARDDIRAVVGRIVVSPGKDGKPVLRLEGDLAGTLSLLAGTIISGTEVQVGAKINGCGGSQPPRPTFDCGSGLIRLNILIF